MSARNRALLIAGGICEDECHSRYANDLRWWSEQLNLRGFQSRVCLGDGNLFRPLFPTKIITDARKATVLSALSWLDQANGLRVLFTSNHGDNADTGGYATGLCLWGDDILTPEELADALTSVYGRSVLVMGQCFAGAFGIVANANTVVLAACGAEQSSFICQGGEPYDEFLYQLGAALFGFPVDAPGSPEKPTASIGAAFHRAKEKDRVPDKYEDPQLFDPAEIVADLFLPPVQIPISATPAVSLPSE